ncbi:nucleotidyltransferase substrate binding protein [Alkalibacillus haloalkaliphilus]|uniref:Nucleotidyltransferase n=1 Tax=Alkalibacillus haloalkaliphilus TaxID=94136 RepID=A0A511W5J9_9BACI|nr:nucleotidyltransferase substrate binding protein [Alkalibacillus haloalkaliphilus]GEN46376.1 nucleotidyltransferase [Alkalibacillus haloalkaliphilus]
MDSSKELRWKQRFDTFEQSFLMLAQYSEEIFEDDLEKAGFIHMFEVALEHGLNTIIDYLDAKNGVEVSSHRQAIKESAQYEFIANEQDWMKALNRQNLTHYIHTKKVIEQLVVDIQGQYYEQLKHFYVTLKEEKAS